MHRIQRGWMAVALVGLMSAGALAQQTTPINIDSIAEGDEAMFRQPRFSGSTDGIVIGETSLTVPYDLSRVVYPGNIGDEYCPSAGNCLDDPAIEFAFAWGDPTDTTTAGVRGTTLAAANFPRPSVHLGGKIKFNMAITAFSYEGDTFPDFPIGFQDQSGVPSILMCLSIIETGRDLPLGAQDSGGGDIEFVYLPLSEVIPAGNSEGIGPFPPGGKRFNATADSWPPEDDDFIAVEFDLSAITSSGLRGFANDLDEIDTAGDGMLDATAVGNGVNRGALEAIIFTNDPGDDGASFPGEYFFIYIDDIVFEAPDDDPTPPPTVQSPILRGDTTVTVTDISTNATEIVLKKNGVAHITTSGISPLNLTSYVFDLNSNAEPGVVYTATQTVDGLSSIDSIAVTVSFPAPVVGFLPKDGDTTVKIIDIDNEATAVELFVDDASRGITTNGNTTLPYSMIVDAGTPLVIGEVVTVKQYVGSGISDVSEASVVTTNGIKLVFCDDFEYADQSAFDAVWTAHTGDAQLQLSSDENATVGGSKSAYSDTSGSGLNANQSQLINPFGPTTGTDTRPIIWNLSYHDGLDNSGLYRQFAEIRATDSSSPLIALGKTNQIVGNYHSTRLVPGLSAWGNLSGFNQPTRTNGWHVLTAVIKTDTVDLYVNGELAAINISFAESAALTQLLIGPGLSSAGGPAYFDDICVETGHLHFNTITTQPPPAPTVEAPILPGATSITVVDVNTNSTKVALFLNGGGSPISTTGVSDQTSVTFSVAPAVSNDYYTATQTANGLESKQSDQVFVLLPAPVVFKAPADGEDSVRVLDLDSNATLVEVLVNSNSEGTVVPGGAYAVTVPLSVTLVQGDLVTAKQYIGAIESVETIAETVTVSSVLDTLVCDDFDSYADQTAFEVVYEPVNFASSPGESIHVLNQDGNATPSGVNSVKTLTDAQYRTTPKGNPFSGIQGTALSPAVFNISIYDPTAQPGPNEWASLVNWSSLGGGTDFFLAEIGLAIAGFSGGDESHYQGRLIGNGPFNWFQLDQYEAPERSIGWHAFTMVFKGPAPGNTTGHMVDVYVDGLLARKNLTLVDDTLLVTPMIGSGQTSSDGAWYDDFCAQLGPVRFNEIEVECPSGVPGDVDNDGDVDLGDVSEYGPCTSGPGTHFPIGCGCADFDADSDVDLLDFQAFQEAVE